MKKIYTINTVNNFMEIIYTPFAKPFEEANEDIQIYNIMDDSLLADTRVAGGMTPAVAERMYNYAKAAEAAGADGIVVTCTSVNQATKYIKPLLNIPIINIEEPVAEQAVTAGSKIGVLATLPTSPGALSRVIREKAAVAGKEVEIIEAAAEGAFDQLCAGDREGHDEAIRRALKDLAGQVDVIAFAQISMSLLEFEPLQIPVYRIGESGFARMKKLLL